jgi:hypothetical protein
VPAGKKLPPHRKGSNSVPDRGHSARRPKPRRGQ